MQKVEKVGTGDSETWIQMVSHAIAIVTMTRILKGLDSIDFPYQSRPSLPLWKQRKAILLCREMYEKAKKQSTETRYHLVFKFLHV